MVLSWFKTPQGPTSPSNVLAVSIVLPVLCVVAVAFRFNARLLQKNSLKLDDWLTVPALLFVIGMAVCTIIGVHAHHLGYNTPTIMTPHGKIFAASHSDTLFGIKLLLSFAYFQPLALTLIKFAALAFYGRIFQVKTSRTVFDIIRIVTSVVVGLWCVAAILLTSLQCGTHFSALWNGPDGFIMYCAPHVAPFQKAFAIPDFILDAWILVLPLPKVFSLKTTKVRKFAVSGVFLLATVGLVGSGAQLAGILAVLKDPFGAGADPRLENTNSIYWANLEVGMSLLAVNLPSLWFYMSKTSAEKILASIRSLVSLQSFQSKYSQGSHRLDSKDVSGLHGSSMQAIVSPDSRSEAYAMYDVEAQKGMRSMMKKDAIVVSSAYATGE